MTTEFECNKCDKLFKTKQNLQLHISKKIPCDRELKCERCFYTTTTKFNLDRHLNKKNKCKVINLEAENEILKLKLQLSELKNEKLQINSNNTINITNNNNITNNITLNNFGNESGKFFTKKNIIEMISTELDNHKIMWNDPILKNQKYLLKDNKNEYKYSLTTIPVIFSSLIFSFLICISTYFF